MYRQVLSGEPPYLGHEGNVQMAIRGGVRPRKPHKAETLGFTDGLWWTLECCWMEDRDLRPDVKIVLLYLTQAAWAWDKRPPLGDSILIR